MASEFVSPAADPANNSVHAAGNATCASPKKVVDPLLLAIGELEAAEIIAGWSPGGPSFEAMQAAEDAWGIVLSTRAASFGGLAWKLERAWSFYDDESQPGVTATLARIMGSLAAGHHVGARLTSLAERLGEGFYADVVRSAAEDAAHLEAMH